MVLKSGREKGKIISASILIGALLVLGACFASASALPWNPSAGFFSQNSLFTLLNALKIADITVVCGEAPMGRLRNQVIAVSQFCVCSSSNPKLFEGRSEILLYAHIAGSIFYEREPNGTDMISLE